MIGIGVPIQLVGRNRTNTFAHFCLPQRNWASFSRPFSHHHRRRAVVAAAAVVRRYNSGTNEWLRLKKSAKTNGGGVRGYKMECLGNERTKKTQRANTAPLIPRQPTLVFFDNFWSVSFLKVCQPFVLIRRKTRPTQINVSLATLICWDLWWATIHEM